MNNIVGQAAQSRDTSIFDSLTSISALLVSGRLWYSHICAEKGR